MTCGLCTQWGSAKTCLDSAKTLLLLKIGLIFATRSARSSLATLLPSDHVGLRIEIGCSHVLLPRTVTSLACRHLLRVNDLLTVLLGDTTSTTIVWLHPPSKAILLLLLIHDVHLHLLLL